MAQADMFNKLSEAVLQGDDEGIVAITNQAIENGLAPLEIITKGMAPGVRDAGKKFSDGQYFLPELIMAGEAMKAGLALVLPIIEASTDKEEAGRVAIGTVEGDVHDLGKNIVSVMLTASGFHVIDLGVDVSPAKFIETIQNDSINILAMGSYLSTTLPSMGKTMEELKKSGLRDKVKVMVGGVSVTQTHADKIGADGYAMEALEAVRVAQELVGLEAEAAVSKEESSAWRGMEA